MTRTDDSDRCIGNGRLEGSPAHNGFMATLRQALADIHEPTGKVEPMKTLLIFACLGLSIAGGHLWAIALNFHLPIFVSVIGAIATVSGGLLAGLIGAADEIEG